MMTDRARLSRADVKETISHFLDGVGEPWEAAGAITAVAPDAVL
jgi:hypothetical protein